MSNNYEALHYSRKFLFYSYFFLNLGEVSGAQIRQTTKLNKSTIAHTNIDKFALPALVKTGSKNVPAAAPKRLIVIHVPTPVPRTLTSNNSVVYG